MLLPAEPDDTTVPDTSGDIEEMVVLATGRDDFLTDMSVSATSFSAAEVKSLRIQNIADLADYTPNLEINTRSAASNPTLFIRGIGLKDYNANAAGAVAVYQDGININAPALQLGQLFDVEQITVLRGPQGSLNGRNATAGAIMVNAVLPDGETDASASFTYGNFNNLQAEGAISLPIVEDLLSTRMAFTANFRDGIVENHCAGWDPESVGRAPLTEQTIRDAWVFNGSPTNRRRFPKANDNREAREKDAEGRHLAPDEVCIWSEPGYLLFDVPGQEGEAVWTPNDDSSAPVLADFQGLKHKVNDVANWATRMILRLQPDVDDGMDWILNVHGGQNLGDSVRLQPVRAEFLVGTGNRVDFEGGSSESLAAFNSGPERDRKTGEITEHHAIRLDLEPLEGIREVDGVFKRGSSVETGFVEGGLAGSDIDAGFYNRDGDEKLDTAGGSLRGVWDTGSVVLTSLSGGEWYDRTIEDEGDSLPEDLFAAILDDSAWQLSQELRAEGEGETYRWFVGGFFLHEDLDAQNVFPAVRSRRTEQAFSQVLTSSAVYAGGRYWLLDEVYFDGGIRYNRERKRFSLESIVNALDGGQNAAIGEETVARTWTAVTGDATLAWEPGGDWMYDARLDFLNLYLKYGRGTKGGHFNAGLTYQFPPGQSITPVDPEFIDSVEVGFTSRWFQDRLLLNFAFFRYWYQSLQVFDYINEKGELPIQGLISSDAKVIGAEIEIQARPLPGLLLQVSGGWLDSEFVNFQVSKAVLNRRGDGPLNEFDYSGNPLIAAPEWNFSGRAEYQLDLFGLGTLVPQYDFSYRSKVYLDPQKVDAISQDPYWHHNVRLAYRTPDGRIEVAGWVDNVADERYKIDAFDLTIDQNTILEVWNDPRTYGVTFSFSF